MSLEVTVVEDGARTRHTRGLGVCYFSSADVVRHPLVQVIVDAYDARERGDDGDG